MNSQYEVELVFSRIIIKRNLLSESLLRISLLQSQSSLNPQSRIKQVEQLLLRKNKKSIDLDAMRSFKFILKSSEDGGKLSIRYEIKGTGDQRVRGIPINSQEIINAIENQNKSILQEKFGGQNAQLLYMFYIKKNQQQGQNNVAVVGPQDQQNLTRDKRSSSISRTKRPPNLNLSKKNKISQHEEKEKLLLQVSPSSTLEDRLNKQKILLDVQKQSSVLDSPLVINKKASAIPISEIQKVNILISTHHRPKQSYGANISYKIKIVFGMIVLGIFFLAYDTFSDKAVRVKKKGVGHGRGGNEHHVTKSKKKR